MKKPLKCMWVVEFKLDEEGWTPLLAYRTKTEALTIAKWHRSTRCENPPKTRVKRYGEEE